MWGWLREARIFASRSKRAMRSGSRENSSGTTLIATSRPSVVSVARHTTPIPPSPMRSTRRSGGRTRPDVSDNAAPLPSVEEGCARAHGKPRTLAGAWAIRNDPPARDRLDLGRPHAEHGLSETANGCRDVQTFDHKRGDAWPRQ